MRTESTVQHLLRKSDGNLRGMLLEDGSVVDVSLKHSDTLRAMFKKGDEVRVDGAMRWSGSGRLHIQPKRITLLTRM